MSTPSQNLPSVGITSYIQPPLSISGHAVYF